jgi:CPA2 family monovalent cation:H+ antiporter-2
MHVDPLIPPLVAVITVILILGLLLQTFRQPQLVGYIVAGIVIGPAGLGIVTDIELIGHLGAIGVTLLLFFVGMEVSPAQLASGWRIAIVGTLLQVMVSVLCVASIGAWLDWSLARIVLLGFVISLSSTAVVLKLLKDRGELDSRVGNNVLLILLAQDLAVVPMLIAVSFLSGEPVDRSALLLQVIGGVSILGLAALTVTRPRIRLPFAERIRQDHELQVFAGLLICFGLAFVTGALGLSAALGAFVGGIVVSSAKETSWLRSALEPIRVVFVAILFVSMGMLIETDFFIRYWDQVLILVLVVFITNTFINALVLKALGESWRNSLYSAALLAQIGEFSFVLASIGLQAGIIEDFSYQTTIAVIALTLLFSPAWIAGTRRLLRLRRGLARMSDR